MARYTFSIQDSKNPDYEPIEVDLADDNAARIEAILVITGLAKDALPDGDTRDFSAHVTDGNGDAVFEANLSFRSNWLRDH